MLGCIGYMFKKFDSVFFSGTVREPVRCGGLFFVVFQELDGGGNRGEWRAYFMSHLSGHLGGGGDLLYSLKLVFEAQGMGNIGKVQECEGRKFLASL